MRTWREGAMVGAIFATAYSAWVIVAHVSSGGEALRKIGVGLGEVILAYYAGGIVAGAIVGALWHRARTRWQATIVGLLATLVVMIGVCILLNGLPHRWDRVGWIQLWGATGMFGITLSNLYWSRR